MIALDILLMGKRPLEAMRSAIDESELSWY